MFNFNYDKVQDYNFDDEGYPISRKSDIRRSFDSKAKSLRAACNQFLRKKDNGLLYDVDREIIEDGSISHEVEFNQDFDGKWSHNLG